MQLSEPKESFNPLGFAIGISFGIPYGIVIQSLPLGIATGLAFGFSLSLAIGREHAEVHGKKENEAIVLFIGGLVALLLTFLAHSF